LCDALAQGQKSASIVEIGTHWSFISIAGSIAVTRSGASGPFFFTRQRKYQPRFFEIPKPAVPDPWSFHNSVEGDSPPEFYPKGVRPLEHLCRRPILPPLQPGITGRKLVLPPFTGLTPSLAHRRADFLQLPAFLNSFFLRQGSCFSIERAQIFEFIRDFAET
jgi:hypothetical protein